MNSSDPTRPATLLHRIRCWTVFFMFGLILSGATAIPLRVEVARLAQWTGAERVLRYPNSAQDPGWAVWLLKVRSALDQTGTQWPFLYYGTDWLAFGHFVIALVFVGALLDPVRNRWLFEFGIIACLLVIPYALAFGAVRGIPFWWRLIDCCFGLLGLPPLILCRRWTCQLSTLLLPLPGAGAVSNAPAEPG